MVGFRQTRALNTYSTLNIEQMTIIIGFLHLMVQCCSFHFHCHGKKILHRMQCGPFFCWHEKVRKSNAIKLLLNDRFRKIFSPPFRSINAKVFSFVYTCFFVVYRFLSIEKMSGTNSCAAHISHLNRTVFSSSIFVSFFHPWKPLLCSIENGPLTVFFPFFRRILNASTRRIRFHVPPLSLS